MLETSSFAARTLALVACTAVFAGIWSNDRPLAASARTSAMTVTPSAVEPEWEPVPESVAAAPVASTESLVPANEPVRAEVFVQVLSQSKTFSIESTGLLISAETLQAHLDQLPLGLANGDYRIVDGLGGVGWLRVRGGNTVSRAAPSTHFLSTAVGDESVRFIRIPSSEERAARAAASDTRVD